MMSVADHKSPKPTRTRSYLSTKMLNSWVYNKRTGNSPSFKEPSDNIVMTAGRRKELRNFANASSFYNSKISHRNDYSYSRSNITNDSVSK